MAFQLGDGPLHKPTISPTARGFSSTAYRTLTAPRPAAGPSLGPPMTFRIAPPRPVPPPNASRYAALNARPRKVF